MPPPDDLESPTLASAQRWGPQAMRSVPPDESSFALQDLPEVEPKHRCEEQAAPKAPEKSTTLTAPEVEPKRDRGGGGCCEEVQGEEVSGLLGAIRRAHAQHLRTVDEMLDRLEGCMACGAVAAGSSTKGLHQGVRSRDVRLSPQPSGELKVLPQETSRSAKMSNASTIRADSSSPSMASATVKKLRSIRSLRDSGDLRHEQARMRKLAGRSNMWSRSEMFGENSMTSAVSAQGGWRGFFFKTLAHPLFDGAIGAVILMNALTIGVELTVSPTKESSTPEADWVFGVLENLFMIIYVAELALRIFVCGKACLKNGWVIFDTILVVVGVVGSWLIPLFLLAIGDGMDGIDPPMFLRIFRLARLARTLRLFMQFQTLWMLVSGLGQSVTTIMNVFIVLTLTLFVFACCGVEVITHNSRSSDGGQFEDLVEQYWGTLPTIMLTLVQFVTLDSAGQIYAPMIKDDLLLVFFFLPFLLVVSVILMNLVTAVVIEVFLAHTKKDQEMRKMFNEAAVKRLIPELRDIFGRLDVDGSGLITPDELDAAPEDLKNELEMLLSVDSLYDLFEALDVDCSKSIDMEEFLDGMTKIVRSNKSLEMCRVLKMLSVICDGVGECRQSLQLLRSRGDGRGPAAIQAP